MPINIHLLLIILGSNLTKTYYATLFVTNNAPNDVELKWNVNGKEQSQIYPIGAGGGFDVTVKASAQPGPIEFKAYQTGTTTLVKLNGQDNLMVTPTETKTPVNVVIGGGGVYYFCSHVYAFLSSSIVGSLFL